MLLQSFSDVDGSSSSPSIDHFLCLCLERGADGAVIVNPGLRLIRFVLCIDRHHVVCLGHDPHGGAHLLSKRCYLPIAGTWVSDSGRVCPHSLGTFLNRGYVIFFSIKTLDNVHKASPPVVAQSVLERKACCVSVAVAVIIIVC